MPQGNGGGRGQARSLWCARNSRVIHCLHAPSQRRRSTRAWAADQFRAQHQRSSNVLIASEEWNNQARAEVRVQLLRGKCHISNYVHGRANAPLRRAAPHGCRHQREHPGCRSRWLGCWKTNVEKHRREGPPILTLRSQAPQLVAAHLRALWCDTHRGFDAWICWPRHRSHWRDGVRRCGSQRDSLQVA